MFNRRTTGSVVCPSCGSLVGVRDARCYSCGRSNPGLWGFGPALRQLGADFSFTQSVVGACVTVWVATLLMSGSSIGAGGIMSLLSPSTEVLRRFGASGAYPVFVDGRWWTVLSAGWLHAGLLHIGMNMYWLWQMGPALTELFGPARTVIIYTAGGVAGFTLSSVAGAYLPSLPLIHAAGLTVGASAPLFGMIGALYHYGRTGSSAARQMAVSIMIQALIFGLLVPGIDNFAHLGGFAGGYFTSAFLNPMTRERGDHMLIAVCCLVASALSIAASLLINLPSYR
ncbi:MAG: rhomboid family intramembrane serine protease [Vicinamibacterales bacterium]